MWVYKVLASREEASEIARQSQIEAFDRLLGAFRLDGHVLGRDLTTVSLDRHIEAYVLVPGEDAFDAGFLNEWISKSMEQLKTAGLLELVFIRLGKDPSEPDACACRDPSYFILFTSYTQRQSPVSCGDCFRPHPLYRLPRFESGEFVEIVSWADDYKACDSLFMNSTTGVRFGYRQISEFGSSLSRRGRAICRHFEEDTRKPFYYYIYRHTDGNCYTQEARACPGCGGEWKLSARLHGIFDFKCDRCHVLSRASSLI